MFDAMGDQSRPLSIIVYLEKNREYQFRYLVNSMEWHNDWEADRYVPNPYSGDNSIVNTYEPNDMGEQSPV